MVDVFIRVLEQKHPYTKGHSQRVQALMLRLAKPLHWNAFQTQCASVAALLHDIGKIIVELSTLNNHSHTLTPDEQEELADHPYTGAQMVAGLFPTEVGLGILQHHERWDGQVTGRHRGYPLGLRGREISPIARAISVIDAYDAMTTKRTYADPMPVSMALERLTAEAGTHFDPKMVNAFVKMMKSRRHSRP